ncbi:hypothetical protein DPMN_086077 [Dreissena polymorpha]|uniref:Uncharacterized protein n=1 Tax=Dreissena polymorpha TaxID=45954 RepID=A0A9D3YDH2_DREPO|nr:hypothetical protein DPMN_086077 [Dreissena polymorpha]
MTTVCWCKTENKHKTCFQTKHSFFLTKQEAGGTGARPHELKYDPSYVLYGGGASFLLNIILFRLVSPVVSGCLVPAYRTLSIRDRMDWNDRFITSF